MASLSLSLAGEQATPSPHAQASGGTFSVDRFGWGSSGTSSGHEVDQLLTASPAAPPDVIAAVLGIAGGSRGDSPFGLSPVAGVPCQLLYGMAAPAPGGGHAAQPAHGAAGSSFPGFPGSGGSDPALGSLSQYQPMAPSPALPHDLGPLISAGGGGASYGQVVLGFPVANSGQAALFVPVPLPSLSPGAQVAPAATNGFAALAPHSAAGGEFAAGGGGFAPGGLLPGMHLMPADQEAAIGAAGQGAAHGQQQRGDPQLLPYLVGSLGMTARVGAAQSLSSLAAVQRPMASHAATTNAGAVSTAAAGSAAAGAAAVRAPAGRSPTGDASGDAAGLLAAGGEGPAAAEAAPANDGVAVPLHPAAEAEKAAIIERGRAPGASAAQRYSAAVVDRPIDAAWVRDDANHGKLVGKAKGKPVVEYRRGTPPPHEYGIETCEIDGCSGCAVSCPVCGILKLSDEQRAATKIKGRPTGRNEDDIRVQLEEEAGRVLRGNLGSLQLHMAAMPWRDIARYHGFSYSSYPRWLKAALLAEAQERQEQEQVAAEEKLEEGQPLPPPSQRQGAPPRRRQRAQQAQQVQQQQAQQAQQAQQVQQQQHAPPVPPPPPQQQPAEEEQEGDAQQAGLSRRRSKRSRKQ